jgi:short-subunit dehydrogenase
VATALAAMGAEIRRDSGSEKVSLMLADLAVQTEVRKLAEAFKEQRDRLDVLVNNVGLIRSRRTETPGGISWPSPRTTWPRSC